MKNLGTEKIVDVIKMTKPQKFPNSDSLVTRIETAITNQTAAGNKLAELIWLHRDDKNNYYYGCPIGLLFLEECGTEVACDFINFLQKDDLSNYDVIIYIIDRVNIGYEDAYSFMRGFDSEHTDSNPGFYGFGQRIRAKYLKDIKNND